ncbi:MAG: thioredoxin family protein [Candidatus Parabeggiatoa sp. nov. 1]|nr:MAG: thioredoxin family protein [Gammaproteobacteria bacterium]
MYNLFYFLLLLMVWAPAAQAARIGFLAPEFTLQEAGGEEISLFDFRGKHIVLEWFNPDCVDVQRHYRQKTMHKLVRKHRGQEVIWLAINSTYYMAPEDNIRWKDINRLDYRLLSDFDGKVGKSYQVEMTPQIYIINPAGFLIYSGAIDDDPKGDKIKPFNYVQAALEKSLAGLPVSYPETEPYGCFVKYSP